MGKEISRGYSFANYKIHNIEHSELLTGVVDCCRTPMEAHIADSIFRSFHVYANNWLPLIGEVLVCQSLNEIFAVFNLAVGA